MIVEVTYEPGGSAYAYQVSDGTQVGDKVRVPTPLGERLATVVRIGSDYTGPVQCAVGYRPPRQAAGLRADPRDAEIARLRAELEAARAALPPEPDPHAECSKRGSYSEDGTVFVCGCTGLAMIANAGRLIELLGPPRGDVLRGKPLTRANLV